MFRARACLALLTAVLPLLSPAAAMAQDPVIAFHLTFLGQPFDGYHATEAVSLLLEPTNPADPWIESGGHIMGWDPTHTIGLISVHGDGLFEVAHVNTYDPATHCTLTGANLQPESLAFGDTTDVSVTLDWVYCPVGVTAHSAAGGTGSFEVTGGSADLSFGGTVDSQGGITYTHVGVHGGAIPHNGVVSISFFPDAFSVVQVGGRTSEVGHGIQIDTIANTTIAMNVTFFRPPNFTVTLGGNSPTGGTVAKGSTHVPMLEFKLDPASAQTVNSVTLKGQGTGNEQVDVSDVALYHDVNGNGRVDSGDSLLASSTYPANDGTVTLSVAPPFAFSGPTNLLVTYSFNTSIAAAGGGALALAFIPVLFLPVVRRRRSRTLLVLGVMVTLGASSCGGGGGTTGPNDGGSRTYQVTLTGLNQSGIDHTGLTLAGGTITVER